MHDIFCFNLQLSYHLFNLTVFLYFIADLQKMKHQQTGLKQLNLRHFLLFDNFLELGEQPPDLYFLGDIANPIVLKVGIIEAIIFEKLEHKLKLLWSKHIQHVLLLRLIIINHQ